MIRSNLIGMMVGVSVLAISACDRTVAEGDKAVTNGTSSKSAPSSEAAPSRIACLDPETGKLIEPGPDVECSVAEEDKLQALPVVKELEGGGRSVDLNGKFDKNQAKPASANRMAVIDRKTGKLMTQRPSDPRAAARYDRSIERARIMIQRQIRGQTSKDILYPEVLADGGILVDLQGRFQMPLIAERSEDGQIHLRHQH